VVFSKAREREKLVTLKSRRKEYKETAKILPNPQTQLEKRNPFLLQK
jgi:hypothetical protein